MFLVRGGVAHLVSLVPLKLEKKEEERKEIDWGEEESRQEDGVHKSREKKRESDEERNGNGKWENGANLRFSSVLCPQPPSTRSRTWRC